MKKNEKNLYNYLKSGYRVSEGAKVSETLTLVFLDKERETGSDQALLVPHEDSLVIRIR